MDMKIASNPSKPVFRRRHEPLNIQSGEKPEKAVA
jgi:hypothetical protein